jgi:hypothetical protein
MANSIIKIVLLITLFALGLLLGRDFGPEFLPCMMKCTDRGHDLIILPELFKPPSK